MNPTVGTRLLVVDDDRLVVATLARELRAYGYVVEDVSSAQDAFERCECSSFDLALVDIRMPGTSGLDFARSLSERWSVPCIFLSAYSDPETVREAQERGALGYLVKPVSGGQVVPAIETALARARDEKTLRERERHLSVALSAAREASIAVGIVMAREGIDRVQAFELLRRRARTQRRKLNDIATEVVLAAERLSFGKPPAAGAPERDAKELSGADEAPERGADPPRRNG